MTLNCFEKPIIIVGAPRSGTTYLKELLSFHHQLWHLPAESHHILEGPFHPGNFSAFSNRPDDQFTLSDNQLEELRYKFYRAAINIDVVPGGRRVMDSVRGNRYLRKGILNLLGWISKHQKPQAGISFLEKTPKNIVRTPAIQQLFPNAKFIYLKRNPVDNIASLYRGWMTKTGFFYKLIKGRPRFAGSGYQLKMLKKFDTVDDYWKFVLPPGWEEQNFREILDIAIFQYCESTKLAEKDFQNSVKASKICNIQYEELSSNTEAVIRHLLSFAELPADTYNFDSLRKMPRINTIKNSSVDGSVKSEIVDRLTAMKVDF